MKCNNKKHDCKSCKYKIKIKYLSPCDDCTHNHIFKPNSVHEKCNYIVKIFKPKETYKWKTESSILQKGDGIKHDK